MAEEIGCYINLYINRREKQWESLESQTVYSTLELYTESRFERVLQGYDMVWNINALFGEDKHRFFKAFTGGMAWKWDDQVGDRGREEEKPRVKKAEELEAKDWK